MTTPAEPGSATSPARTNQAAPASPPPAGGGHRPTAGSPPPTGGGHTSIDGPDIFGLVAQAAALAAGQVSSAELVAEALRRAEAVQDALNPFKLLRPAEARAEAAAADERLRRGQRAPLLGVPVVVKDDTDLAGTPTAFGCPGTFPAASHDAEIVRRLRQAGAVIIAKTNTPELGQWPFTEGAAFGATRNPWDPARSPGGSSGGTAAAVAAGVVAAGTGSDGAGSIRIPAAWCHLVGIKPPRGRVATFPDEEAFLGLTTHGTLARTVADAASLLDAVAGAHASDRHRLPEPAEPFAAAARRDPGRLRIGLALDPPFTLLPARLHTEVGDAVQRLAGILEGLGHVVEPVAPPYGLMGLSFLPRSMRGLADWERRLPDPTLLDPRTRDNCRTGRRVPDVVVHAAVRAEAHFARRMGRLFRDVDVLLTPTTATGPLAVGATDGCSTVETDRRIVGACPYTWPWNVLGWPGINVPAGFTAEGLPVGAQLLGPVPTEATLVSLAAQLEAVEHWERRFPPPLSAGPSPTGP